jgi:hypothetical protein
MEMNLRLRGVLGVEGLGKVMEMNAQGAELGSFLSDESVCHLAKSSNRISTEESTDLLLYQK